MAWLALFAAGLLEICWAVGLKQSHGFSRLAPSIFTIVTMIASFAFLTEAMKTLPLGTVYAVWTGIGTIGAVIFGVVLFGESMALGRMICIGLIIVGVAGLRLTARS
jgi:quaternary ammonium compound-resistance protein SugE